MLEPHNSEPQLRPPITTHYSPFTAFLIATLELEFLVSRSKQTARFISDRDKIASFDSASARQIRTQKYLNRSQLIENTHPPPSQIRTEFLSCPPQIRAQESRDISSLIADPRLEFPATYSKQRFGTESNRLKTGGCAPSVQSRITLDARKEVPYSRFRSGFGV